MKPAPFDYRRPESVGEALAILAEAADEAKPIAGGQSLVPLMAMRLARPAVLVDLGWVPELRGFEAEAGGLRVGATACQSHLERAGGVPEFMKDAIRHVGHFQIRNRGTVGGSLAHADPAAEWPALAVACGATMDAESARRGRRSIAAEDFFKGPLMTALEPDELLIQVIFPQVSQPAAFVEVERRAGDFALVGAIAHGPRLVVFGAGPVPQRLIATEQLCASGVSEEQLQSAALDEIVAVGDIHAGARYRRQVGAHLVLEVVRRAAA